jgi:hypothetical protein
VLRLGDQVQHQDGIVVRVTGQAQALKVYQV